MSFHVRSAALYCAALCLFAPAMHAGLITFNASGVTANSSTLSGTVVIDTTAGTVQSLSFTMSGTFSFTETFVDSSTGPEIGPGTGTYGIIGDNSGNFPLVTLVLPVSTLVGYTGGNVCLNASPCNGGTYSSAAPSSFSRSNFTSGSLTAATPEPASIALVGMAMLGLAAWRFRRNA